MLQRDDVRAAIEARGLLSGLAASLCRVVGAKTSWKAMQEALLKRFAVKHADDHWQRNLTSARQQGYSTADYLLRVRKMLGWYSTPLDCSPSGHRWAS